MKLKYYEKEKIEFKDAYGKNLTYDEVRIIFKKLCHHFKINCNLQFGRGSNANRYRIQLSNCWGKNFGVLCHELSHVFCIIRDGKSKHNKKLWKVHRRMVNYCRKKNFWETELKTRTEVKVISEPAELDLKKMKIERVEKNIINCEKRLRYFTKLYTNKIKRYNRSLNRLKKNYEIVQSSSSSVQTS